MHLLLVSNMGERCGIQQFGRRLFRTVSETGLNRWSYVECDSLHIFRQICSALVPDAIIFNRHPITLPWSYNDGIRIANVVNFAVQHEFDQGSISSQPLDGIDVFLYPDLTLISHDPRHISLPRFTVSAASEPRPPAEFTVSSFGFGTSGKGFQRLCALVNSEFDRARIRINIPPHDLDWLVTTEAMDRIRADCISEITRPGVKLEITSGFMSDSELIDFLQTSTINAFLYDRTQGRGISSCTDYALASRTPFAISGSQMFRHLHSINPSIQIEHRSLRDIATSGFAPLEDIYRISTPEAAGPIWNKIIEEKVMLLSLIPPRNP